MKVQQSKKGPKNCYTAQQKCPFSLWPSNCAGSPQPRPRGLRPLFPVPLRVAFSGRRKCKQNMVWGCRGPTRFPLGRVRYQLCYKRTISAWKCRLLQHINGWSLVGYGFLTGGMLSHTHTCNSCVIITRGFFSGFYSSWSRWFSASQMPQQGRWIITLLFNVLLLFGDVR